jgi:hypothetical protein
VVLVSCGESIFTRSAPDAQEAAGIHFEFFPHPHVVHRIKPVIRISQRFSTALCTTNPQVAWRNSENASARSPEVITQFSRRHSVNPRIPPSPRRPAPSTPAPQPSSTSASQHPGPRPQASGPQPPRHPSPQPPAPGAQQPAQALPLVPLCSRRTPVTADTAPAGPVRPSIRHGCRVHAALTT